MSIERNHSAINHLLCCQFLFFLLELTFPNQNQPFIQQACCKVIFYFRKEKFYQDEEEGRINRQLSKARKICGIVDR